MRDRDTLILESLYQLVCEGAKETTEKLKKMELDDDTIKKFIDVDVTSQKMDAINLGKLYKNENPNIDDLIRLYKEFVKFKKKNNSQTKDFSQQFRTIESLDKTIGDLNSIEAAKFLKDKTQTNRMLGADKSVGKTDSLILAKWVAESGGAIVTQDAVNEYLDFSRIKEQNVQGSESLENFADYGDFTNFVHVNLADGLTKNEEEEEELIVGNIRIPSKPDYDDENVAIWGIDSVSESIGVGNALIDMTGVRVGQRGNWCTTWPIDGGSTNMYATYRTGAGYKWTFYYVWNKKRKTGFKSGSIPNDKWVIAAIGKKENGRYSLTPAPNNTIMDIDWNGIVREMPELKGKEDIFVYKPVSQEKATKMQTYSRLARYFNEREFLEMSEFDQWEYISEEYDIPLETFKKLSKERRNDYINLLARSTRNRKVPEKFFRALTPNELKRYEEVRSRVTEYWILGIEAPLDAI
jgi:hypothetical protein